MHHILILVHKRKGDIMENNYFKLYLHTAPNGKRYYGITKRDANKRWGKNGNGYKKNEHFWNAIKLYGWSNIKHEVLFDNLTEHEAKELEQYMIQWYDTANPKYGYNQSLGGEGGNGICGEKHHMFGKHLSEKHKDNISKALKGKYIGENNPNYGKLKGELNPMYGEIGYDAKKVINIDTGEIFESIAQAAKSVNGKGKSLSQALHHGLRYKGIAFKFYDDYLKTGNTMRELKTGSNSPLCKKVIRLDTLEIFDSVRLAAESIGENKDSLSSSMSKGYSYKGIPFKYYDDYLKTGDTMRESNKILRKVINTETGEIFESIVQAAESINANPKSLGNALRRGTKYKGIKFEYYNDK